MSDYTLSVVQLCPDAYKDAANAIAEAAGYGPGNLSVELRDSQGGTWWGCHAPWIPEVFAALTAPTGDPSVDDVLAQVVTSAQTREDYLQHWTEVLAANGLSVVQPPEA
ncbi:hypothetical protein D3C78_395810 [compost metagenome]